MGHIKLSTTNQAGCFTETLAMQVRYEPIGHEDLKQAQRGESNRAALDFLQVRQMVHDNPGRWGQAEGLSKLKCTGLRTWNLRLCARLRVETALGLTPGFGTAWLANPTMASCLGHISSHFLRMFAANHIDMKACCATCIS